MCGPRHCNEAISWEALTAGKAGNFSFASDSNSKQHSNIVTTYYFRNVTVILV